METTPTLSDTAEWLADFVHVNGAHLRPNVAAMHEAAIDRRHGLDDNDGLIGNEHHAALFACCLSGDADLWLGEVSA